MYFYIHFRIARLDKPRNAIITKKNENYKRQMKLHYINKTRKSRPLYEFESPPCIRPFLQSRRRKAFQETPRICAWKFIGIEHNALYTIGSWWLIEDELSWIKSVEICYVEFYYPFNQIRQFFWMLNCKSVSSYSKLYFILDKIT